jgi:ribosomal protein S18 acetylase RimI-like enzyme
VATPLGPQFRPPRGDADADALLAIRRRCAEADGYDPLSSTEALPSRDDLIQQLWAAVPERWTLVELNSQVVAYGRINTWTEGDGTRVFLHLGWVLPEWRGKGIGTALLRELERRIKALAAAESAPRWEYAANASSTEPEATQLVLNNGYRPGYTVLEMGLDWAAFEASLARTFWPSGFDARPVVAEHLPAIAAAIDEAYRDEYPGERFHEPMDVPAYAAELLEPPFDLALFQVAWDGDAVAGQVLPRIERGRAEIYEVSVRPAYRRRGLGRALLTRALLDLRARGVDVVRLHTMGEFPTRARDLYEALGFRVLKTFPRYRKPGH